jgi:flavorubredoxin
MKQATKIGGEVLYRDESHQFIWLGADPESRGSVVQTNQYLIIHQGRGILFDPGGIHLFSRVISVASRFISLEKIDTIIFSHQDPDVSSGIALWLGITPAKVYISGFWIRFLPHFGIVDTDRIISIEDSSHSLKLPAGGELRFIPAPFLHSVGNYTVYDSRSKILFSADIGSAVFENDEQYLYVEDFDAHAAKMEGFHKRYMTSGTACRKWADVVSRLDIEMIAPQHGAVFRRDHVEPFLSWFGRMKCGIDFIDELYAT